MLRTPTTYLLPVTVISPAMCVEAMMISAPLNSLLYSPTLANRAAVYRMVNV